MSSAIFHIAPDDSRPRYLPEIHRFTLLSLEAKAEIGFTSGQPDGHCPRVRVPYLCSHGHPAENKRS
jgi:hypothetical protein